MTKSQINKLGEKLRKAIELDTETLLKLQQFRASYDGPMLEAQTLLRKIGFESTSRLKTTNTIIEKLRRERTRLAEMQDIGGLRTVSEVDLTNQDKIVKRIVDAFPVTRVIDRRTRPTHGYRAVHVIATLDDRLIEIQVRTQLQDHWAQAMERLADEAGREIRYGGAPQKRGDDVENLLNISTEIAWIEGVLTKLNDMETGLPPPQRAASMQRELRLHIARIQSLRADLRGRESDIRAMLEALIMRRGVPKVNQFLLRYRRSTGDLLQFEDLGPDRAAAMKRRLEEERVHKDDSDVEVVLLAASSREALVRTHARYFKSVSELAAALGAALPVIPGSAAPPVPKDKLGIDERKN